MIRRCHGFTLFEMVLAIMLISALVFTLLPAVERVMSSSEASAERVDQLAQLAILGDLLDRSLWTGLAADVDGSPGVHGKIDELSITTTGVPMRTSDRTVPDDILHFDLVFDAERGEIRLRENDGRDSVLVQGASWVEISYHNGSNWVSQHTGDQGLPRAVAVSVWFEDEGVVSGADEDDAHRGEEQDRGAPDWCRVFAVLDPDTGSPEAAP